MDAGLLLQYVVVALAVAASAAVVAHKQFPAATRRIRVYLAVQLLREGRAPWLGALGRALKPAPRALAGCNGCDGCGTAASSDRSHGVPQQRPTVMPAKTETQ